MMVKRVIKTLLKAHIFLQWAIMVRKYIKDQWLKSVGCWIRVASSLFVKCSFWFNSDTRLPPLWPGRVSENSTGAASCLCLAFVGRRDIREGITQTIFAFTSSPCSIPFFHFVFHLPVSILFSKTLN